MDSVHTDLSAPNVINVESSKDFLFEGGWLMSADYVRQGNDLLLIGEDGKKVFISD